MDFLQIPLSSMGLFLRLCQNRPKTDPFGTGVFDTLVVVQKDEVVDLAEGGDASLPKLAVYADRAPEFVEATPDGVRYGWLVIAQRYRLTPFSFVLVYTVDEEGIRHPHRIYFRPDEGEIE